MAILILLSLIQAITIQNLVDQQRNILVDVLPRMQELEKVNDRIKNTLQSGMNTYQDHKHLGTELTKMNTRASNILFSLSEYAIQTNSSYKFQGYLKQREILKRIEHQTISFLKYGKGNEQVVAANKKWNAVNENIQNNLLSIHKDLTNESQELHYDIRKTRNSIIAFLVMSLLVIILMSISITISIRRAAVTTERSIEDMEINVASILSSSRDVLLNSLIEKRNTNEKLFILFTQIHNRRIQQKINSDVENFIAKLENRKISLYSYQKDEYVFILSDIKHSTEAISFAKQILVEFKSDSTDVNIGISSYPDSSNNIDTVLNSAIRAMHESKSSEANAISYR